MTVGIEIRLTGTPPEVAIIRGSDVEEALWRALGRHVAPGRTRRESDDEWRAPLDAFLGRAPALAQMLTDYECPAALDAGITARLDRGRAERKEVDDALSGGLASLRLMS